MSDAGGETTDEADQRDAVRDRYGAIAADGTACCGDGPDGGPGEVARAMGYDAGDLDAAGADLSLGCGNPTAIAGLAPGETVLDLGSGGGFDCFLAAREVGPDGRVVGVDMTPEMVERARENAAESDLSAVEFRLGEIEHLPVADASVDVVLSNCVLNLSPDKPQVLREAFRVLAPGGRLAVSDVVLTAELPPAVAGDLDALAGCVAGAATPADLARMLRAAGFVDVSVEPDDDSGSFVGDWDPERDLSDHLVAATIEATKPTATEAS